MGIGGGRLVRRAALAVLGAACLLGVAAPVAAGDDATPTWQLTSYRTRGWDRSFKCDLAEELDVAPRVVVFGGSRGMRMDPSTISNRTGLPAFNFAFHNGHPEDAWAVTDWLLDTYPDQPPAVVWCIQATTLADIPMAPGLILDERLSQAFPTALIEAEMPSAKKEPLRNLLSGRRYRRDGLLLHNAYDRRRAQGQTLKRALDIYLQPKMLAKAGNRKLPGNTRAKQYFARTIRLLNSRGIKPLIVIMPYHPRALKAFRSVGWGVKERWLRTYLSGLQKKGCTFRIVNCVSIRSFGGNPAGFYDGSHLTVENSRRLLRYCMTKAPGCFRVPPPPTPSDPPIPEEPSVTAPQYTPVPEISDTPGDLLE